MQSKRVTKDIRHYIALSNRPSVCLASAALVKANLAANSKARIGVSGAADITGKEEDKRTGKEVGILLPPHNRSRRNTPDFPMLSSLGSPSCWKQQAGTPLLVQHHATLSAWLRNLKH